MTVCIIYTFEIVNVTYGYGIYTSTASELFRFVQLFVHTSPVHKSCKGINACDLPEFLVLLVQHLLLIVYNFLEKDRKIGQHKEGEHRVEKIKHLRYVYLYIRLNGLKKNSNIALSQEM